MPLNFSRKPLDVLRRSITQRLSNVPPRPLAQRALATLSERALVLNRLLDVPRALPDQLPRRPVLQPGRKDVPTRGARGHLEPEVARAVDELEHGVRRVVARAVAELVYARVAAGALRVARRERFENFRGQGRLEEEARGFFPGRVRAFFPQCDDLAVVPRSGQTVS